MKPLKEFTTEEGADAEGLKARNVIAWVEGAPATEAQVSVTITIQACRAEINEINPGAAHEPVAPLSGL